MSMNIDFNSVKGSVKAAYHTVVAEAKGWMGYAVVEIKSGVEATLPYFQDTRIAVISLIAITVLSVKLADLMSLLLDKSFPKDTAFKREMRHCVKVVGGLGMIIGGVVGFARYTRIPFSPFTILGISFGTLVIQSAFIRDNSNEKEKTE